jgi:hypothetical protein
LTFPVRRSDYGSLGLQQKQRQLSTALSQHTITSQTATSTML